MAPELMRGQFGKPADIFRYQSKIHIIACERVLVYLVWESVY